MNKAFLNWFMGISMSILLGFTAWVGTTLVELKVNVAEIKVKVTQLEKGQRILAYEPASEARLTEQNVR